MNKVSELLASRKFWASLLGLLAVFGLWGGGDVETAKLVDSILVIVGSFVTGTAIESGLRRSS